MMNKGAMRLVKSMPAIFWMIFIYYLSSLYGVDTSWLVIEIPFLDKFVHFGLYGVLGTLLAVIGDKNWLVDRNMKWIAFCVVVGALYGLSDEFHQSFVPTRDVSMGDWIFDVLGVGSGVFLVVMVWPSVAAKMAAQVK